MPNLDKILLPIYSIRSFQDKVWSKRTPRYFIFIGQCAAHQQYTLLILKIYFAFRSESLGLIPQSLSLIFQKIQENQDEAVSLHVSFLEIYKEKAYDLLGPLLFRGSRKIKELPKVRAIVVFLMSLLAKKIHSLTVLF